MQPFFVDFPGLFYLERCAERVMAARHSPVLSRVGKIDAPEIFQ